MRSEKYVNIQICLSRKCTLWILQSNHNPPSYEVYIKKKKTKAKYSQYLTYNINKHCRSYSPAASSKKESHPPANTETLILFLCLDEIFSPYTKFHILINWQELKFYSQFSKSYKKETRFTELTVLRYLIWISFLIPISFTVTEFGEHVLLFWSEPKQLKCICIGAITENHFAIPHL